MISILFYPKASHVTVGLQQMSYEVNEEDMFAIVCTAVLSGSTAGRTITIGYQTSDGDAIGKPFCLHCSFTEC